MLAQGGVPRLARRHPGYGCTQTDCRTGPGKSCLGCPSLEFKFKSSKDRVSGNPCSVFTATAGRECNLGKVRIAKGDSAIATTESSERGRHDFGRYLCRSLSYRPRCHKRRGKQVETAAVRLRPRCPNDREQSKTYTRYNQS